MYLGSLGLLSVLCLSLLGCELPEGSGCVLIIVP